MREEVDKRLRKVFYQNVDDNDGVYVSGEAMHIDALEVFNFHDDVDGHEETHFFLVIELLHQNTVGEAIVGSWHLELSQVGLVSSAVERYLTHLTHPIRYVKLFILFIFHLLKFKDCTNIIAFSRYSRAPRLEGRTHSWNGDSSANFSENDP